MIYDISPLITPRMAVFPGDVAFRRNISMEFSKGDHLRLSSIETTLHLGAHADAPSHYHADGRSIEAVPLDTYLGPCQVIDLSGTRGEIGVSALLKESIVAPRVLFKTGSMPDPNQWQEDFSYLAPEVIEYLAGQGVILIGIDTPSVDHSTSKELGAHQAVFRFGMAILEGLDLSEVSGGLYQLIALPLKIKGAEASPVRAVLTNE